MRFCHDLVRQRGRRSLLVPLDLFEIIADELLVERGLRAAGCVLVGGPVAGGIRSEDFVGKDDSVRGDAELEFGVGEDDSALSRVSCCAVVDVEAEALQLR